MYLEIQRNIGSKRAFTTDVFNRWHNCLLIYWRLTHKRFSSCIRRYLVSRACDWVMPALSAVLLTFKFPVQSAFLQYITHLATPEPYLWLWATPALQRTIGRYRATDVAKNLGKSLSGAQRTSQGKDFELILTVKMKTRHPLWGPIGRPFSAFVIIGELWRPEVARPENFVSNFCIFLKKRSFSKCRHCVDRAQNLPGPAPHIWLTVPDFKLVHFRRSYCRTHEDRFCPIEYLQYRLFKPIKMTDRLDYLIIM